MFAFRCKKEEIKFERSAILDLNETFKLSHTKKLT